MPSTHLSLHSHLIFSTKNREPWLTPEIRHDLHPYLGGSLRTLQAFPTEIGGVADHVHLLFALPATIALADLVKDLKRHSSSWLKKEFSLPTFAWQEGYGAFTVSPSAREEVRDYILRQEEHHRTTTFQEEYLAFLEKTRIEYKPEHLW